MRKFFCLIMAAICVAFILTAPAFIADGLGKSIYEVKEERKNTRYEGKIELWHVVSFKTPQSSGYSLLCSRMRELEKQIPYVYIEVSGMTIEEAKKRMQAGERPDVISYPKGFVYGEDFISLERRNFESAFQPAVDTAYPYMADSYVLAVNTDMLFEKGINCTIGEIMEENTFLSAYEKFKNALTFSDIDGLDSDAILDNLVLSEGGGNFDEKPSVTLKDVQFSPGGMQAFSEAKCAMIICPYSEYVKFLDSDASSTISVQCFDISNKTDLVQMVSAYDSKDNEKNKILKMVCECLAGKNTQKKVLDLGMFPTLPWQPDDTGRMSSYQLLTKDKKK